MRIILVIEEFLSCKSPSVISMYLLIFTVQTEFDILVHLASSIVASLNLSTTPCRSVPMVPTDVLLILVSKTICQFLMFKS
jgi:hypothetical protein